MIESRLPVGSSAKMIFGFEAERAGHGDALLLATGQLARPMLQAVTETHRGDDVVDPLRVTGLAAEHHRQSDVLVGGERRNEVERLEDEADVGAAQLGELPCRSAMPGTCRRCTWPPG